LIAKKITDKGISFDCEYSVKEVLKFYELATWHAMYKLDNVISDEFLTGYIHRYRDYDSDLHDFEDTDITSVELKSEAKNGFGMLIEQKVYVYLRASKDTEDTDGYKYQVSDSPLLEKSSISSSLREEIGMDEYGLM
jgi:hypothetical protein